MYRLRVKEVIEEKEQNMTRVAIGAGITFNMVKKMVRNPRYNPTIFTMAKVAKFLDVAIDELVEEIPEE